MSEEEKAWFIEITPQMLANLEFQDKANIADYLKSQQALSCEGFMHPIAKEESHLEEDKKQEIEKAREISIRVQSRIQRGEMITPEDLGGEFPMPHEVVEHNHRVSEMRKLGHDLLHTYQQNTPEGALYHAAVKAAHEALHLKYKNPQGSYSGTVFATLGSTDWKIHTGSGWTEFSISWQTPNDQWELLLYDYWYLTHKRRNHLDDDWIITQKKLHAIDLGNRFGGLASIISELKWKA